MTTEEDVQPANEIEAPEESLPLPVAEDVQPAELESSLEESRPLPPAPSPPPGPPEADRGVSDGTLICTVCLRLIGAGDTFVKTEVRGINHLEPCSHRS